MELSWASCDVELRSCLRHCVALRHDVALAVIRDGVFRFDVVGSAAGQCVLYEFVAGLLVQFAAVGF